MISIKSIISHLFNIKINVRFLFAFIFYLFILNTPKVLSAQVKYAILLSNHTQRVGEEKILAKNNLDAIKLALNRQGFKLENVYCTEKPLLKETVNAYLSKITSIIKKGDFVFIYTDIPLIALPSGNLAFQLNNNRLESSDYLMRDLDVFCAKIAQKMGSSEHVCTFLESSIPKIEAYHSDIDFYDKNGGMKGNYILSCSPNQKNIAIESSEGRINIFTSALSKTMLSGSAFTRNWGDFYNRIYSQILQVSSLQTPSLQVDSELAPVFNGNYKIMPVHFDVREIRANNEIVISGGESLNILAGAKVDFYPAYEDTTAVNKIAMGSIINSQLFSSIVKTQKAITKAPKAVWAYVKENKNGVSGLALKFNIASPSNTSNAYLQCLQYLKTPANGKYLSFVEKGGDIKIGQITNNDKGNYIFPILNPNTNFEVERIVISKDLGKEAFRDLKILVERYAKYHFLYKLKNNISELHVDIDVVGSDGNLPEMVQGYPVFYDKDTYNLKISNTGTSPLYYALIDMQPDKVFTVLDISAFKSVIAPKESIEMTLEITPPFGVEKLKCITSLEPISMAGFQDGNLASRGSRGSNKSFYAEQVNIQDFDYEIRSKSYAKNAQKRELPEAIIMPPVMGNQNLTINANSGGAPNIKQEFKIKNPSMQRMYFNVLKQQDDGGFVTVFPNQKINEQLCFVDVSKIGSFDLHGLILDKEQLITVYSDRPFTLANYQTTEKSINDLVIEIIRNGKISGSPLNKISIVQTLYASCKVETSRGEDVFIKLINPKISTDRGVDLSADKTTFEINGFAMLKDNKPVKTVKINNEIIPYNIELPCFFQKTLSLESGNNKVVIEAIDDKGFSKVTTLAINCSSDKVVSSGIGKNYFLGIGINKYTKGWPQLVNAKRDIERFSGVLKEKFGFDNNNIKLLLDSSATRKNIINTIRSYLSMAGPNDNVIIYLSGHGNEDQLADGDYYFIPQEGDPADITTDVKSTDIMDNFKKIKARHCILIIDACYAGMIANSIDSKSKINNIGNGLPLDKQPSKWIITSGRATKVSDGEPGKNSPFATVMINYLTDNSKDNSKLTITKLIDYLKENVPKINNLQTPFGVGIDGFGEPIFPVFNK